MTTPQKLLVVFGATGSQGGSVITQVLRDAELSREYTIRALTRDPSSQVAQDLAKQQGVEVYRCDNTPESLRDALKGAHTVFAMTLSSYTPTGHNDEIALGKLIADTAVASGAQYLIWSSMVNPTLISGGKYPHVNLFWCKSVVEQYILTLPIASAFYIPGSFMSNTHGQAKPRKQDDGTYALINVFADEDKIPLVAVAEDTGKWIAAILAEPEKYKGKQINAASAFYSQTEIVQALIKATGKKITHVQITPEQFQSYGASEMLTEMVMYMKEFGYYGEGGEELVRWGKEQARGRLTTLDEYLELHPLALD